MPDSDIIIHEGLTIPVSEVSFVTSRSSGPGGQHVNKTATRVTLVFDIAASGVLSGEEKTRLRSCLGTRVSHGGVLRLSAERHRSQLANKHEVERRFATLLREALATPAVRIETTPSRAAGERRLTAKRRRSRTKRDRIRPDPGEE